LKYIDEIFGYSYVPIYCVHKQHIRIANETRKTRVVSKVVCSCTTHFAGSWRGCRRRNSAAARLLLLIRHALVKRLLMFGTTSYYVPPLKPLELAGKAKRHPPEKV
jgi:hypothetical protein